MFNVNEFSNATQISIATYNEMKLQIDYLKMKITYFTLLYIYIKNTLHDYVHLFTIV